MYHITLEKEVVELMLRSKNAAVKTFATKYKKLMDSGQCPVCPLWIALYGLGPAGFWFVTNYR